ncbi:MAG: hypothetical protein HWD61_07750 [Parachlamydiaceae bacterium]|nr:MAG: hypothetical protein HWD61_07750 [Parachlamydiaceae bacterium]
MNGVTPFLEDDEQYVQSLALEYESLPILQTLDQYKFYICSQPLKVSIARQLIRNDRMDLLRFILEREGSNFILEDPTISLWDLAENENASAQMRLVLRDYYV